MGVGVLSFKALMASVCLVAFAAPVLAQTAPPAASRPAPARSVTTPEAPAPRSPAPEDLLPTAPIPYNTLPKEVVPAPVAPVLPQTATTSETAMSVDMIAAAPKLPVVEQRVEYRAGPVPESPTAGTYEERTDLARRLLEVDGTEAIIRHFVSQVHMRLIVGEVGKYIDLNALNETDRYRLATIVATTSTELGDKILLLTARNHAQNLSKDDLSYLAQVNDTDAQRKLTQMRIDDTGELDKNAELVMQIAALRIVQEFEQQ
ncbi:MAG: hypothetical protein QM667_00345 [Asticcacaulis sp.]